jgi:hypothetical protein
LSVTNTARQHREPWYGCLYSGIVGNGLMGGHGANPECITDPTDALDVWDASQVNQGFGLSQSLFKRGDEGLTARQCLSTGCQCRDGIMQRVSFGVFECVHRVLPYCAAAAC